MGARTHPLLAHKKFALAVHLIWTPIYHSRILVGRVATRVRDQIRQIAMELELHIISGNVAHDLIRVFSGHRPSRDISTI